MASPTQTVVGKGTSNPLIAEGLLKTLGSNVPIFINIRRLRWLRIEKNVGFQVQHKSSITHHAEGNSMASPTQTVAGKGTPNPLIAEGLLKILLELVPSSPLKSLTNSHLKNGRATKIPMFIFLMK